jgi:hypothetical protein
MMRSLLAIPAASLAFAGTHPHAPTITGAEAVKVLIAQVHKQAPTRLRGGYHSETLCSGRNAGQEAFSSNTELSRWHCTLELTGARFPSPCKAQAYVSATSRPHQVRIERLTTSRYCHDH